MQIIEKLSTKIYSFFHSEKGYLDEGVVICIMTIFACLIILFLSSAFVYKRMQKHNMQEFN